jgi:hypothetical protein
LIQRPASADSKVAPRGSPPEFFNIYPPKSDVSLSAHYFR